MNHICPYCGETWNCETEIDFDIRCDYPEKVCCTKMICLGKEEQERLKKGLTNTRSQSVNP